MPSTSSIAMSTPSMQILPPHSGLSDALPTFSCRSTPFRVSGSSQQRIATVCSATCPSLGQAARRFGLFLLAAVVMRSMERRLVALQETVWHTLLTLEDSAALWLAVEAEAW